MRPARQCLLASICVKLKKLSVFTALKNLRKALAGGRSANMRHILKRSFAYRRFYYNITK